MISKPLSSPGNILLFLSLALIISCSAGDNSPDNVSWDVSEGVKFPEGEKLSRAEDGVILPDGTLIVADQRYGLVKIDLLKCSDFGSFQALSYEHNPLNAFLDRMEFISRRMGNILSQPMCLMEKSTRHQCKIILAKLSMLRIWGKYCREDSTGSLVHSIN